MKKHIYDKQNGLHYTLGEDGLYYPDIVLDEQEYRPIGKYGRMREHFLKEHRTGIYISLLLSGTLNSHLFEIDTLVSACGRNCGKLIVGISKDFYRRNTIRGNIFP